MSHNWLHTQTVRYEINDKHDSSLVCVNHIVSQLNHRLSAHRSHAPDGPEPMQPEVKQMSATLMSNQQSVLT